MSAVALFQSSMARGLISNRFVPNFLFPYILLFVIFYDLCNPILSDIVFYDNQNPLTVGKSVVRRANC